MYRRQNRPERRWEMRLERWPGHMDLMAGPSGEYTEVQDIVIAILRVCVGGEQGDTDTEGKHQGHTMGWGLDQWRRTGSGKGGLYYEQNSG